MKIRKAQINKWDWLLIIGLSLAPMTGLRIWKIGPSEMLCLIWSLRYLPKRIYRINDVAKFFFVFLGSMMIGTIICSFIAPKELIIAGLFTWIYLTFIALALYEGLRENDLEYNEKLLSYFCFISAFWYLFLYFYSIYISKSFLGAPLWYSGARYTGGATNPHQIAVMMCGLTFCFTRNIIRKKLIVPSFFCVIVTVFLVLQTASSTALASIFIGFFSLVMILAFYRLSSTSTKVTILVLELIIVVFIIIIFYSIIYRYFYGWLSADANGLGRLELFSLIGITFMKSPFFGLGPGTHAGGTMEFHNTYIEILAATGAIGFSVFFVFTIRTIKKLLSDATLLPIMIAIYAYGLAGFAMRRLVYWGIFIFIYIIAEQIAIKKKKVV